MNGIDEIIARINAEALSSENLLRAEYEAKINDIKDTSVAACAEIAKRAEEKAEKERKAMRLRAENRAGTACRDELLTKKRELIDAVFSRAAESFSSMEKGKYVDIMAKLLSEAASDETVKVEAFVLVSAKNSPASGKEIAEKAGVKPGKISESEEIKAGFIIRTGLVEINCTPEKLIAQRREALLPAVTAVLFG